MTFLYKKSKRNIFLSTGGSGGHLFPALFISLTSSIFSERIFIAIDKKVFKYTKFRKHFIYRIIILTSKQIHFVFFDFLILCIKNSFLNIKSVIFFGNYTNIILFLISLIFNLKIFLNEQNAFFGQVNLFCSFFAKKIFASFPPQKNNKGYLIFGLPIIFKNFPFIIKKTTNNLKIFIIGGSQGALIFNNILPYSILFVSKIFCCKIQLTQQIQQKYICKIINLYSKNKYIYSLHTFCKNILLLYSFSDIVVSRSGASTIIELILLDKFSISVPYFYSKNNHQFYNSKFLKKNSNLIFKEEFFFSHEWFIILICKLLISYRELLLLRKIKLTRFRRLNFFSIFRLIKELNFFN